MLKYSSPLLLWIFALITDAVIWDNNHVDQSLHGSKNWRSQLDPNGLALSNFFVLKPRVFADIEKPLPTNLLIMSSAWENHVFSSKLWFTLLSRFLLIWGPIVWWRSLLSGGALGTSVGVMPVHLCGLKRFLSSNFGLEKRRIYDSS